jgi:uncharacterized protein YprB with RNaseH-like and TPR domain
LNREPRIAFIDIETAPSLGFFFDKWKENNIIATKCDWYMLSFAVKWFGEKRVRTYALPDYGLFKRDKENDRELIKDLHAVFDEADILIAHNGDRFDIRKSNARFIQHGLKPPSQYKTIDTLKVARRYFKFDSNRLNDLGQSLGVGKKLPHTGSHLWLSCMAGVPSAWRIMRRYNARDVELLERVYEKLKPWAVTHPNLNLYSGRIACPTCQSTHFKKRGLHYLKSTVRQRMLCLDCGTAWSGETIRSGSCESQNNPARATGSRAASSRTTSGRMMKKEKTRSMGQVKIRRSRGTTRYR